MGNASASLALLSCGGLQSLHLRKLTRLTVACRSLLVVLDIVKIDFVALIVVRRGLHVLDMLVFFYVFEAVMGNHHVVKL